MHVVELLTFRFCRAMYVQEPLQVHVGASGQVQFCTPEVLKNTNQLLCGYENSSTDLPLVHLCTVGYIHCVPKRVLSYTDLKHV
jgi:hypothetical protein